MLKILNYRDGKVLLILIESVKLEMAVGMPGSSEKVMEELDMILLAIL